MTHDLLDDLVRDVPRDVSTHVHRAWRAGVSRRRRARAAWASGVGVALVVVGLGVHSARNVAPVAPADSSSVVDGHPRSVPRPLSQPVLPASPGPMAGVFAYGHTHWSVVAASGRSWRVPDVSTFDSFQPALSDDGTKLGWLRADDDGGHTYVLADLVTGQREEFPQIGGNRDIATETYMTFGQTPSFWSPDGRWLMIRGSDREAMHSSVLLLGLDGALREVVAEGYPVGWQGADRIVWLGSGGSVRVTDLDGSVVQRQRLPVEWEASSVSQWSGRVSPDGATLAVVSGSSQDPTNWAISIFSLSTGELVAGGDGPGEVPPGWTTPMWAGERPVLWLDQGLVDPFRGDIYVTLSSRWVDEGASPAGYWASDALAGETVSTRGLVLDWRYWTWLSWWRQILAGAAGFGLVLVVRWRVRRARRRDGRSA